MLVKDWTEYTGIPSFLARTGQVKITLSCNPVSSNTQFTGYAQRLQSRLFLDSQNAKHAKWSKVKKAHEIGEL